MADTPETPKPFSRIEYLRNKAEREARETPEEKARREADASSGLQKAAEQFAREQSATGVFKQAMDSMHKASLEKLGAAREAGRVQHKADMEEAFSSALSKSKSTQLVSSPVSHSVPDEIQKILDATDLWDAKQSKVSPDHSFIALCRSYVAAKRPGPWEIISMIAAVLAPVVVGVFSGTQAGLWSGLLAGLITVLVEIAIGLFLFLFFVPSRIWLDVAGDLKAARNQIAEDRRKLQSLAGIARRYQQEALTAKELFNQARNESADLALEKNLLKSQLDSSYKVVLEVDTVGRSAEMSLPQRSRIHFVPVPGDDGTWSTGLLSADIRMRFDSRSETTRVRINSVVAFMVIGASQRLISDISYFVGEGWDTVDFANEAYSHVEPLKRSPYYLMSLSCDLSADDIEQLSQNIGILRLVMDAANQPNYCVDLAISHWDEIETSSGSAATILKEGGCPA